MWSTWSIYEYNTYLHLNYVWSLLRVESEIARQQIPHERAANIKASKEIYDFCESNGLFIGTYRFCIIAVQNKPQATSHAIIDQSIATSYLYV